jgi:hypothetical protein
MTWSNKGLIFRCSDYKIDGEEILFAQSPQPVVLEDRIRVFFCTRVRDSPTTWISRPAFVDFSHDLQWVLESPQLVKISPPALGSFDEHGIFPFHPHLSDGAFLAYSTGWSRRQSVDVETGIGMLQSFDQGLSFERVGNGPVLTASLHEPYLVCDPWVVRDGSNWTMWYLFGTEWDDSLDSEDPQRVYKIGKAQSLDGRQWVGSNGQASIPDVLGPKEAQALPSVRHKAGKYEMVFCYRPHRGFRIPGNASYNLGFASSVDGDTWYRDDRRVDFPLQDFDSQMRCYPSWFTLGESDFIWYNGNEFGKFGFGLAQWTK